MRQTFTQSKLEGRDVPQILVHVLVGHNFTVVAYRVGAQKTLEKLAAFGPLLTNAVDVAIVPVRSDSDCTSKVPTRNDVEN